jgi:type IV pilus assembly protein PilM
MLFNRLPGIGLDIGSKKMKLVWAKRRRDRLQIVKFGSMPTPVGAVDSGIILEPERLGEELGVLVRDLNLKGKRVVSAVAGQQVYIRNLIMPSMKLNELKEAVRYQATTFLPISVEDAAIDIFPLREFEDEEGQKTEVFFVAVRRQQVENLDIACRIAGLNLAAVEIEPLAVYRVLGGNPESVVAFLKIGSSRSYLAVFKGGILKFYRSLPFGSSAFYQNGVLNGGAEPGELDEIEVGQDNQYDYLLRDIISEVKVSIEYYEMQNQTEDEDIERLLLCGSGSAIRGLDSRLEAELDHKVEVADILPQLILPEDISDAEKYELKHNFVIALGLAAREVV